MRPLVGPPPGRPPAGAAAAARAPHWVREGSADDPLVALESPFWNYRAIGVFDGAEACVIDPGIYPGETEALAQRLATCALPAGAAPRRVTHVVVTHHHHDHLRGWHRFPGARIVAPRLLTAAPAEARARSTRFKRAWDERLGIDDPDWRWPEATTVFDDEVRFRVGGLTVIVRRLPGHSDDACIVLLPELRALLPVDYLVLPGLPYCRGLPAEHERALLRLRTWCRELGIERALPGHNLEHATPAAIEDAIALDLEAFAILRDAVRGELAAGTDPTVVPGRAAARLRAARGARDPRDRQDLDNARRVLDEERARPTA